MTLQHTALEVRRGDVDAEVRFWGLLGFAPVPVPDALAERSAWVARGATQIHLLFADDPVVPRDGHVAVVCEDYAATQEALTAAGHRIGERERHWGAARCFVRSPGRHLVEIMAAPPPAQQMGTR